MQCQEKSIIKANNLVHHINQWIVLNQQIEQLIRAKNHCKDNKAGSTTWIEQWFQENQDFFKKFKSPQNHHRIPVSGAHKWTQLQKPSSHALAKGYHHEGLIAVQFVATSNSRSRQNFTPLISRVFHQLGQAICEVNDHRSSTTLLRINFGAIIFKINGHGRNINVRTTGIVTFARTVKQFPGSTTVAVTTSVNCRELSAPQSSQAISEANSRSRTINAGWTLSLVENYCNSVILIISR